MAKAVYQFSSDASFNEAARTVLLSAFSKMMDNAKGTQAGLKKKKPSPRAIEALHDMRVGSRRLRAALSVFAKAFAKTEYRHWDKQIGGITDALGAVRDLDVQIDYLHTVVKTLPPNEAYGINRLIIRQTKKRDKERKHLLDALALLKKSGFKRKFRRALDAALPEEKAK